LYGSTVQVYYHDVKASSIGAEHQGMLQYLQDERLPLPAVFLNGQLLYAGLINALRVVADVARTRCNIYS
jgi:hypothetical protein